MKKESRSHQDLESIKIWVNRESSKTYRLTPVVGLFLEARKTKKISQRVTFFSFDKWCWSVSIFLQYHWMDRILLSSRNEGKYPEIEVGTWLILFFVIKKSRSFGEKYLLTKDCSWGICDSTSQEQGIWKTKVLQNYGDFFYFEISIIFPETISPFFLRFRRPNLITGLSGWRTPD